MRYVLELEFDGTAFFGTQAQARERTLQGVMAAAVLAATGEHAVFRPSSRLDTGVSARALPGDLALDKDWPPVRLALALNQHLPRDAVVTRAAVVADGFNARHAAIAKTYVYRVLHRPVRPVLARDVHWARLLPHADLLPRLAAQLVGDHDLSGFATRRRDDSDHGDPRRRYSAASWTCEALGDEQRWTFRITGSGFLYRQVRALVGAMLGVAVGRHRVDAFTAAIGHGWGAQRLGNLAPAHGLLLDTVVLDPAPAWKAVSQGIVETRP